MLQMSEREKYRYDLQGFLIVRGALSSDEVGTINDSIDANLDRVVDDPNVELQGSETLRGPGPRRIIHEVLTLPDPWCEPFRRLLVPERLMPHLNTILGRGWRLDHYPHVFLADKGAEGLHLHQGGFGSFDSATFYTRTSIGMRSGMIVVQYALSDVDEGQGGFCCIPGSHKATYPEPLEVTRWHEERDLVINPALAKGDAIIFNEALTHGTLPWKGDHQRRAALYRYSPHWVNFQHVIGTFTLPDWALELDERERSVLEMPHRYGRQVFNDSGELVKMPIVSDFLPVD